MAKKKKMGSEIFLPKRRRVVLMYFFVVLILVSNFVAYRYYVNESRPGVVSDAHKFSREEVNVFLYGSDYEVYEYIVQNSSDDARILFVAPDAYYVSKTHFFLYPRRLEFLFSLEELDVSDLEGIDMLYIYQPLTGSAGVIPGLSFYSNKNNWSIERLYEIDRMVTVYLEKEPNLTQNEFEQLLVQQAGNLLYTID